MIDLKRFRKDNKIPQKEIYQLLDIEQSYLSAIENGRRALSKERFEILYNKYGDILLKYKLPDIVIENAVQEDITVSREAWDLIKLQVTTINSQQQTIHSQQATISLLSKGGGLNHAAVAS